MILTEISEKEFSDFRETYPLKNFWQSVEMTNFKKSQNWHTVYVGLKDGDKVLACTALVSIDLIMGQKLFQSLRGFMIDYDDISLVDTFLKELKKYLHEHKCMYYKCDPYITYQPHDKDGNPIEGYKRDALVSVFEENGFVHQGFRTSHDDNYEPRWMSVLPLTNTTPEKVLKEMNIKTRQNINNTAKTGIKLKKLNRDELHILKKIVDDCGDRRNFYHPTLEYYQHFYDCFKEDMISYYAYLDIEDYKNKYFEEIKANEAQIKEFEAMEELSKKNQSRLNKCRQLYDSATKRYNEALVLEKEHGKELPLGAAMFVVNSHEIIYLFSGSDDTYKHFKGPYAIQWEMIKYGLEHHIEQYNFYGISGNFNEEADDYGVYLFKKGFNADVEELIGDFQFICNKKAYGIYQGLRTIKHAVKG